MRSLLLVAALVPALALAEVREDFGWGWKFARFGPQADGSTVDEPGTPPRMARASSEESGKGNTAEKAIDADANTRWCASSGQPGEWLQVDLGRPVTIATIDIQWERDYAYRPQIEVSSDAKSWTKAATDNSREQRKETTHKINAHARHVRVTVNGADRNTWASISELRVVDAAGKTVQPSAPAASVVTTTPLDPSFDDTGWRSVNLPHDWGIEGPFRADLPNETGKLPWPGIGWYRKTLVVPATEKGRRLFLHFDGAMAHPKVFVNGEIVGEWAYGYTSFRCEITRALKFGGTNVIAVRLDNPPDSSRWYPGGGIYRNLWLIKTEPVHVANWGIFVTTPEISKDSARIHIAATIENQDALSTPVSVRHVILDPSGTEIGDATPAEQRVRADSAADSTADFVVKTPKLWEITAPHLYTVRTIVSVNGRQTDSTDTRFGIRSAEWNADKGFLLNGRVVPIRGVCNHHDLGPLGTAVHARALERQLEILKDMGCNAIRTSHNPPAPEFLDLCDRMGFVVMDEAFDCWKKAKKPNDYHRDFDTWHERDVMNLVRRDRNHPSVVLWSCGNEIPEQGDKSMHHIAHDLVGLFHREDPTRKVIAGCNYPEAAFNGFADALDVHGYNYKPHLYGEFHKRRPTQPVVSSESASCVSSRGEYFFPVAQEKGKGFFNYQVSSYDLYAPPWASKPDIEFVGLDKYPNCAGEFVWTGFDYYGEPTPFNSDRSNLLNFSDPAEKARLEETLKKLGGRSPSRSSYFGIIDICGFPKDRYYIYQARWRPELPMAHILPHWNWPDRPGQATPVHVYTSGDSAELFLNGRSLGRKQKAALEYRLVWDDVAYEPGELKVAAYKDGKPWAQAVMQTTGKPSAVSLDVDRARIAADGRDLSFVTIKVVDAKDRTVPRANHLVKLSVNGPAEFVGVENGDATSHAPVQASEVRTYNGLALVVLRSKRDQPGQVTLTAAADSLGSATARITTAVK